MLNNYPLSQDYDYQQRILELQASPQIQELYLKLDADSALAGAGVVYVDHEFLPMRLREASQMCRKNPIHIIIHEIPPHENRDGYPKKLVDNPRESRLVGEAVGTVMSCGAAFLGWLVIAGSVGVTPVTGGASGAITVLTWGAALASSAQCANGLIRSGSELVDDGITSDILDSQQWYQETTKALDVISLAGAASSALAAFKAYQLAKTASSRGVLDILKGMTRAERKRMTEEIVRINHPGISNGVLKAMIRSGEVPKRFSNHTINHGLMLHVKDAIGATLSFSGSAFSGTVKDFVIGVYEESE